MEYLFIGLCGVIVGLIISRMRTYGTLKIDTSNPEKDLYKLEIKDLNTLPKKKCIVLKVDARAKLSQE